MIDNTAPYDLNIPVNCGANTTPTTLVKRALALGYRTVALNVQVVFLIIVFYQDLLPVRRCPSLSF